MKQVNDGWACWGHKSDFKCNLIGLVSCFFCFIGIGICMLILAIEGDDRWIVFGFPWAFMGSCVVGFWCATYEHWKWMRLALGGKGNGNAY